MSCQQYQDLMISHICGELDQESSRELENHLESCTGCRTRQSEFSALLGIIKQIPKTEWNEKLRIREMLRRRRRWQTIVFSKAALWLFLVTGFIAVLSYLPIRWELSAEEFTVRWGDASPREEELTSEIKKLQMQLGEMQKQNHSFYQTSESRLKQLVDQNSVQLEKRYWQTLEMFSNYIEAERKADLRKIQRDIAASYDRTGSQVDKTNELLEYVLQASTSGDASIYDSN